MKTLLSLSLLILCSACIVNALVDNQPQQIHLSLGATASEMVVTWLTMDSSGTPIVEYGQSKLNLSAQGQETEFIDGGELKVSRFIQRVTLANLTSGQSYRYRVGGPLGWSSIFQFTALRTDADFQPTIAVFGDLGNENGRSIPRLQKMAQDGEIDAVFHDGDFAYDMADENGFVGDEFMRQMEPITAYVPYQVAVGNHENAYNFSHYDNRFSMVNSGNDEDRGKLNNFFYSFNIGPVHVISFSTEFYFYVNYGWHQIRTQFEWLEKDLKLANANRDKQPWIITMGHRPMYCSDDFRDDCSHKESITRKGIPVQQAYGLEDLLYNYGVDLGIWGHEHVYERFLPVYDRELKLGPNAPYTNPTAPVHVTSGSAGCKERVDVFVPSPPAWSAVRISDYGFGRMKIYNSSHLHFEQISDDQNGTVVDDFWLIKDHHGPYSN